MFVYKQSRKAPFVKKEKIETTAEEGEKKTHLTNLIWENFVNLRKENENHNLFSSWFINLISVTHAK